MSYWITSTNESRLDEWRRQLHMERLPVTTARPMMLRRGAWKRPFFMIDADQLTINQRLRLVGWVWRVHRVTAVAAASMVESGVLIDGRDCEVVEPVEESPASLFVMPAYAP